MTEKRLTLFDVNRKISKEIVVAQYPRGLHQPAKLRLTFNPTSRMFRIKRKSADAWVTIRFPSSATEAVDDFNLRVKEEG